MGPAGADTPDILRGCARIPDDCLWLDRCILVDLITEQ